MKILVFFVAGLMAFAIHAAEDSFSHCTIYEEFPFYQSGVLAEKAGETFNAFEIYCNLAFRGDYRAQFKLAQLYQSGVDGHFSSDLKMAYVWASMANSYVFSKRKQKLIDELTAALDSEALAAAKKLYGSTAIVLPTGRRIDQNHEPVDVKELWKKKQQIFTGSRIKTDKPIRSLKRVEY